MPLWKLFQRKKADTEPERRQRLLQTGRITEGKVIDCDGETSDDIRQIFYIYSISGSDYESSYFLTDEQRAQLGSYAPGATVSIRFDPRQPSNSIVV